MARVPDPYRALGLSREATTAEVRAAHRRLAKRYHPDAPHADASRFLAVQDAYELLRDPVRRSEWDRRHAPGPVRARTQAPADERAATRRRQRSDDAPGARGQAPADGLPQADHWTWSAREVPWWEDAGAPRSRRASRRRAAPSEATEPPGARAGTAGGPDRETGAASDPTGASASTAASEAPAATDTASEPRNEFDVYSRSSGAAWSSASRAYFRRRSADMPSGAGAGGRKTR